MIVFMKLIQNKSKEYMEYPLSSPLTIDLIANGDEWVGQTEELEPGFYQYRVVY